MAENTMGTNKSLTKRGAKMAGQHNPHFQELHARIAAYKQQRGDNVAIEEVAEVVSGLVMSMQGDLESAHLRIGTELKRLLDVIHTAKEEIAAIQPNTLSKRDIPTAADELDAIVSNTEEAAGKILDAADELTQIAGMVEGEAAERLQMVATNIFEASSFQDITGQRITKVVRVLKLIEERLATLAEVVGDTALEAEDEVERTDDGVVKNEKDLLNGPQLEGDGNSQDDIDALLAGFD